MQKSREELIRAESDLSALRVEKSEIEGSFLRDKEEARDLHRKMVEVGQQVESMKSEIEKVKKDAKQQKGLLAIAKKQLSSRETEKVKIEKELEDATAEVASVMKEREEAESDLAKLSTPLPDKRDLSSDSLIFAASHSLPVSPDPSTPAGPAAGKSNNPFERLALSPETSSPHSQSPFAPSGDTSQPATSSRGDVDLIESAIKTSTNDPFGFPQRFESHSEFQPSSDVKEANDTSTESRSPTPKLDMVLDSVRSPASTEGSEQYATPPTTANNPRTQTPAGDSSTFSDQRNQLVEDTASQFPEIGTHDTMPGQFPEAERSRETDLAALVKEIEVEDLDGDSDSDSDSEDEVPLAELAKTKSQDSTPAAFPAQEIMIQPEASFDDIFGVTPPTAADTSPFLGTDSKDTTVSSILKPSTDPVLRNPNTSQSDAPTVAGVSAFDEAMGIIPNTTASSAGQFSFDSAFDDNFDFASATKLPLAPAVTVAEESKNVTLDNLFTLPARNGIPGVPPHNTPDLVNPSVGLSSKTEPAKPTFDEAFLSFDSGPALDLDNSFSSPPRQVAVTNSSPAQAALPVPSPPISPKFTSPSPIGTVSPTPRAKSPPPRVSSPKPRPSTSSSKEAPDKLKEPSTRHSKLSVRMPVVRLFVC
jgi:epidermal growth factor receptor substrate 15